MFFLEIEPEFCFYEAKILIFIPLRFIIWIYKKNGKTHAVIMANFLRLSDVRAYKKSLKVSNEIWDVVATWKPIAQYTIGEQCIKAMDSISANIAEGFGRYHKKDKIKFYYYSRGSVYESLDWIQKSFARNLLSRELYEKYILELRNLILEINALIKLTKSKLSI